MLCGQGISALFSLATTRQNFRIRRMQFTDHLSSFKLLTYRLKMKCLRQIDKRCCSLKRVGFSSIRLRLWQRACRPWRASQTGSHLHTRKCKLTKKSSKRVAMRSVRIIHLQLLQMQWDCYDPRIAPLRRTWNCSIARSSVLHQPSMSQIMFSHSMVLVKAESATKMMSLQTFLPIQKRNWDVIDAPRIWKLKCLLITTQMTLTKQRSLAYKIRVKTFTWVLGKRNIQISMRQNLQITRL